MHRWILAATVLACAGVEVGLRCCSTAAPVAPFADRLPHDVVLYASTTDATRLRAWAPELEKVRGPVAIVARPGPEGLDWIAILDGSIFSASGTSDGWHYESDGLRIVAARSPEALRRFREAPRRALDVPVAQDDVLFYAVPGAFPSEAWPLWCVRWRDFASVTGSAALGEGEVRVKALARWAPHAYRNALEHLVQAPGRAAAPPDAVAWTCQVEHFPRVREHPLAVKLGPTWGAAIDKSGELVAAVESRGVEPSQVEKALEEYPSYGRPRLTDVWWGAAGKYHLWTVVDVEALSRLESEAARKVSRAVAFRGVRRVEAWTRLTDVGAEIEVRVLVGQAHAR